MRESVREASSTGIRPQCEEWYGVREIPWLQLALEWTSGSKTKEQAKDRFVRAFDGSDLSSYDVHKKSDLKVGFGSGVGAKQLNALPIRPRTAIARVAIVVEHY